MIDILGTRLNHIIRTLVGSFGFEDIVFKKFKSRNVPERYKYR